MKQMLPGFAIDHAYPSRATNLWLTALLQLPDCHIEALLEHRDRMIEAWRATHPDEDVFEDRALEVTGYLSISVGEWVEALNLMRALRILLEATRACRDK
ncbi:hypothetical protein DQ405_019175 [Pseudomonas sp. SST3]|uniref:DUF6969 family protein n=1 Tax=Pseudomonas sp. SST3 TaxID=2267882 RepID=UPI001443C51B|nr:hypothetical protein [Pseudomonas sp. SST3]NKQ12630.1 hypothetical protein [Pseudomonas sp. SST3]